LHSDRLEKLRNCRVVENRDLVTVPVTLKAM
jgi:hypothetical protein